MSDLSVTLKESKVWHDSEGECWILLHVPDNVDTGELCCTLWDRYCKYLEAMHANISRPDAHRAGE